MSDRSGQANDPLFASSAESFFEHTPCGFLSFSDNGSILLINRTLLDLLGYTREELLGVHIDRILTVAGRIYYQTHFFPLLRLREQVDEVYLSLRSKEKTEVAMMISASRHQLPTGDYVNNCVLLTMRERRKFEDELIQARKTAEASALAKDEFLAVASHELRSPLTSITGWLHLLRESNFDPELVREGFEVIERNVQLQSQLVSDILDISRVTSGKLRIEVQVLDIHSLLREAIEVVRPALEAKHITLETDYEQDLPIISGDPGRLQQIFWNLLSNAGKFTAKGGKIFINVHRVNSSIAVTITDTGEGIPQDFLPYIFERFRQADQSKSRLHGGLGLGLAIVKDLVELHGGTISAHSEGKGKGATFEVRIPVQSVNLSNQQKLPEIKAGDLPILEIEEVSDRLDGINLLLVDNSRDSLQVTAKILEQYGARVVTATNAFDALRLLEHALPHVLISDIEMPEKDGLSLIQDIRLSGGPLRLLPAIAFTARASKADSTTTLSAGFDIHLNKPARPTDLVRSVLQAANKRDETR